MSDPDQPPPPDRVLALLEEGNQQEAVAALDRLGTADAAARKRTLRAMRSVAEDRPDVFDALAAPLAAFLTDGDRAVRLTTEAVRRAGSVGPGDRSARRRLAGRQAGRRRGVLPRPGAECRSARMCPRCGAPH